MRTCTMCLETKEVGGFSPDKRKKDGLQARCKKCKTAETKAGYRANPAHKLAVSKKYYLSDRGFDTRLRRMYGIALEQYGTMLTKQGEHCAICPATDPGRGNKNWCVDHDHATGRVRGLLCHRCNSAIGLLSERSERLQNAMEYLATHQVKSDAT